MSDPATDRRGVRLRLGSGIVVVVQFLRLT